MTPLVPSTCRRRTNLTSTSLAFVGVVVLPALLGACSIPLRPAAVTTSTAAPPAGPTTTVLAPATPVGAGDYTFPSGCYRFTPDPSWIQTKETAAGTDFAIGTDVVIETGCSPLDKVGADGPVKIPYTKVVDDKRVTFGGGNGRRTEYLLTVNGQPSYTLLYFHSDRNGVRCVLNAAGIEAEVKRVRSQIDKAAASFVCAGA